MKWNNCSKEEAQEAYDSAKSKYSNAALEYCQGKKQLDACYTEYKSYSSKMDSVKSEKLSFERRIEQLGELISFLDNKMDDIIGDSNKTTQENENYIKGKINCSGYAFPEISKIFRCQSVAENSYSSQALQAMKKEKARLEQAVADVNSKLNAMEQEAEALTKKMSSIASAQASLSKTMKACSYEMNHYKKYV